MNPYWRFKRMFRLRTRLYWSSPWTNQAYVSETPAVIVGGSVRSGTTLMRTMLDSHPSIAAGPESWLFVYRADFGFVADEFGMPREDVEAFRRASSCLPEFIDLFQGEYARRLGKPRWAEKSPGNVTRLDYIWRHFPEARFIHMLRDGRDVACSIKSQRERLAREDPEIMVRGSLGDRLDLWMSHTLAGLGHRKDPRYLEVRYEDLVSSPSETISRVLEFIGEPWSDSVLQSHEMQRHRNYPIKERGTPEVYRPVFQNSIGRWRRDLSQRESDFCWRRAGHVLSQLGYAR